MSERRKIHRKRSADSGSEDERKSTKATGMTYLSKMNPGQSGRVVGFTKDSPVSRRLTELGLAPGRQVIYLRNAPLRDPLEIQVGSTFLSIRRAEASLVTVLVDE